MKSKLASIFSDHIAIASTLLGIKVKARRSKQCYDHRSEWYHIELRVLDNNDQKWSLRSKALFQL